MIFILSCLLTAMSNLGFGNKFLEPIVESFCKHDLKQDTFHEIFRKGRIFKETKAFSTTFFQYVEKPYLWQGRDSRA
jgi:hypothetical protein